MRPPEIDGHPDTRPEHRFIFVGGLHRTGTTPVARWLGLHPSVSGLSGTDATEDEGQHLQSVYPPASAFGGAGRFALHPGAQLTESSPLVSEESRRLLLAAWRPYWDLERPVLLEKSPPNLIRTRFLRALFPGSRFVVTIRHPIAVAYATRKWEKLSLDALLRHWTVAYERFLDDCVAASDVTLVRYEDLIARPQVEFERLLSALELQPVAATLDATPGLNDGYFRRWRPRRFHPGGWLRRDRLIRRYERRVERFGYSLRDPDALGPPDPRVAAHLPGRAAVAGETRSRVKGNRDEPL